MSEYTELENKLIGEVNELKFCGYTLMFLNTCLLMAMAFS